MLLTCLVLTLTPATPAWAVPPRQGPTPQDVFTEMKRQAGGDLEAHWDQDTGIPRSLTGNIPYRVVGIQAGDPQAAAHGFFDACKDLYRMADPQAELVVKRIKSDDLGMSHVRLTQQVDGVPVWGAEVIVHLKGDKVVAVGGEYVPEIALDTAPTLPFEQAVDAARADLGDAVAKLVNDQSGLAVYARRGTTALTWKVNLLSGSPPGNWLYFVNAHDGAIVHRLDQVETARNRQVYTAGYGTTLPGALLCEEAGGGDCSTDADALSAYTYTGDTYDYYFNTFGRDSFDGAGAAMLATVHYGSGYNDAFWNGTQIVFGDGDGVTFIGLARERGVVAHEWTHAVTRYEADLISEWQSGALNESYSDVFGEMVERYATGSDPNWLTGDAVYTPGISGDALRDLSDPSGGAAGTYNPSDPYGDGQPDHMSIYADNLPIDLDKGGVHINSGIPNKAAYLIAQGGTFHDVTVTGVGAAKMEQFYYRALTQYLTPGSDFFSARYATIQACTDLIGSSFGGSQVTNADCDSVRNGFAAVGIGLPAGGTTYTSYLPVVSRGCTASGVYGRVTVGGASASGVSLQLRYNDGSSWSTLSTGSTDSQGCYNFTGLSTLADDQIYYVRYTNPNSSSSGGRMYMWWGNYIREYTAGSAVTRGDFDVADVPLLSPNTTGALPFPVTFYWTCRSAAELYQPVIYDALGVLRFSTNPVYGMCSYTLNSLPDGMSANTQYYWGVRVYSKGGEGESYSVYKVKFASSSSSAPSAAEPGEPILRPDSEDGPPR